MPPPPLLTGPPAANERPQRRAAAAGRGEPGPRSRRNPPLRRRRERSGRRGIPTGGAGPRGRAEAGGAGRCGAAELLRARTRANDPTRLPAPWLPQGQVLLHNGWWLLGGRARTSVVRGRTRSPSARPPVFSLGFSCDAATADTERCPTELLCLTLGSQSVRCGVG